MDQQDNEIEGGENVTIWLAVLNISIMSYLKKNDIASWNLHNHICMIIN